MVIQPSAHARERWTTRADTTDTDLDPEDAWPDAKRVHDTNLTGDEIRYHDDTGTLLVRKGIALVTVIDAYTAEIPTQRAVAKLTDYECPRCSGSTTGEDIRCPDCQRVQDIVGGMTDDELRTDGGSAESSVTTDQPPEDLDLETPVEELAGEELVEQRRRTAQILYDDYAPHIHDWHEGVAERHGDLWNEVRSRADVEEPECPECGGRRWGQAPGDPANCSECGYEAGHDLEVQIHDVWDAMEEEVNA